MASVLVVAALGAVVLWAVLALATLPVVRRTALGPVVARWPTDRFALNHAVAVGVALAGHVLAFGAVVLAVGGLQRISLVEGSLAIVFGYPLVAWLLVAAVGTATGRERSAGGDWRGALGLVAAWYGVVLAGGVLAVYWLAFALAG